MNKKLIINISVFVLIILFLIISFFSIKKVTSNGMKVEVLNNNKVNEQIYISDLIKLYNSDKKKFNKLYKNSKIIVTDNVSFIDTDYIDKESSYSTSYDVISLDSDIKLFVGHGKFELLNDLEVGDKITIESRIIKCNDICLLRDIEYLDDAGFNYNENSKIKLIKRKK